MKNLKVGIIDLQTSNLKNIYQAFKFLELNTKIISAKKELDRVDVVVLPGVGVFSLAMQMLNLFDLKNYLIQLSTKKIIIGVCLGMQLLTDSSEENGYTKGLGLIRGKTKKIFSTSSNIGWQKTYFLEKKKNYFFYYVHRYAVELESKKYLTSYTYVDNSKKICSSYKKDNIIGYQFHPEKSGIEGLNFLKKEITKISK